MNRISILAVVAACGGGSGGGLGTGAVTDSQAEEICRDDCEREIACGTQTDLEGCVTSCKADMVGWARGDAVSTIFACRQMLECDASDDACAELVAPLPIHQEWEDKCRVQLATCVDPTQIDDACEVSPNGSTDASFRFIAPAIMTELIACLDGVDCAARLQCVQDTLDAHMIGF